MRIVTGSIAMSMAALLIGIAGAADAQQSGNAGVDLGGAPGGSANQTGVAPGMGAGTGLKPNSPMPGTGTSAGTPAGATGRIDSGPALNNMRANGTSLDMNPDPRAPNVTGRAAPRR